MSNKFKPSNGLKRTCGDSLSKFLVRNFEDAWVKEKMQSLFANKGKDSKKLKESDYPKLKEILLAVEKKESDSAEEVEEAVQTPEELLASVGYSIQKTETHEEVLEYKKYFREGEALCKFNDSGRSNNYHIYWIVKDNADEIQPSDTPNRQDDYSTSVCSIQISLNGRSVTQITSRYNHSVTGCDNTFNSNLDNIVQGLTKSFKEHYGHDIKATGGVELESFVEMDKRFAHYHTEINGVKFGDNVIVSDSIKEYSKDDYYLYDYFLINLRTCKIEWSEELMGYLDGFVEVFNNSVKKIEFVKSIEGLDDGDSDEICYIVK